VAESSACSNGSSSNSMNTHYTRRTKADDFYTPESAMVPAFLAWLSHYNRIWEPCSGQGHLVKMLRDRGHRVYEADIQNGLEYDVRFTYVPRDVDAIVTNPPFSLRKEIVERFVTHHRKPFALLLPIQTLCQRWYEQYKDDFVVIPITGRLTFVGQPFAAPFYCAWFTYDGMGKQ